MTIDSPSQPSDIADADADADADELSSRVDAISERNNRTRQRGWQLQTNQWMRWVHVYVSMFALLITLFFGITGITLNHPDWTFGDEVQQESFTGTLPDSVVVDGRLEFLLVSEYLRATHDVSGDVAAFDATGGAGTLSYKGPGYGAEVSFDADTLDYTLTVQQQGFVAVMNDLHKGRDTPSPWRWAIDASAGFLVVIAVTGLAIQFLMRKRRTKALIAAGVGSVACVLLIWFAMV